MNTVQRARKKRGEAQIALQLAVAEMFWPGMQTRYCRPWPNGSWIEVEVIKTAGEYVKVLSVESGKEYWIDSYAMEGGS